MENKEQLLIELSDIYNRWLSLIASLRNEQILAPDLDDGWSIKDVVAHLWAWQQASVARAEAALKDKVPDYPDWWRVNGPDPEENIDQMNAYIYKMNRDRPWSKVYADWQTQFERYLELSRQIPEDDLTEPGRYAWMGSYALIASPVGSLDHHNEHYAWLTAWLKDHEDK